jgi:hypothetical protein
MDGTWKGRWQQWLRSSKERKGTGLSKFYEEDLDVDILLECSIGGLAKPLLQRKGKAQQYTITPETYDGVVREIVQGM